MGMVKLAKMVQMAKTATSMERGGMLCLAACGMKWPQGKKKR